MGWEAKWFFWGTWGDGGSGGENRERAGRIFITAVCRCVHRSHIDFNLTFVRLALAARLSATLAILFPFYPSLGSGHPLGTLLLTK